MSKRILVIVLGAVLACSAEAAKLRLLYVACGDQDRLFRISQGVHNMLVEKKVPHLYNVIPGGKHDFKVWKSDLYRFAQLLFREPNQESDAAEKKTGEPAPEKKPAATGGNTRHRLVAENSRGKV
ncbi:MAG TPA: hypothetical protein VFW87_24435 [Pirellulales bacterium]|nr:hypothetical protein [Pirellulales bacterium]